MLSKPYPIICFAHQDGPALAAHKALEADLRNAYRAHVDAKARVMCFWIEIPPGSAFVAGRPSSLSNLIAIVPQGITQTDREALMHAICDRWMQHTGCDVDEVMVATADASMARAYLKAARARFAPDRMRSVGARILGDAVKRRLLTGRLGTSLDMPIPRP